MVVQPGSAEQLALLQSFREAQASGQIPASAKRRWRDAAALGQLLYEDALPVMSQQQAFDLYRASGGRHAADFGANSIEEIRDSLDFLLYDTIKLEGRFQECVAEDGAYKLAGAGKEFISYLLGLRDPRLFGVWNATAERALRRMGLHPGALRQGHWGLRYIDLLDSLQRLAGRVGLVDFAEADRFAGWISRSRRSGG